MPCSGSPRLGDARLVVRPAVESGNEVGGLLGFRVGDRWGWQLLEHPGPP